MGRDVAVKVLPASFSADADRLRRSYDITYLKVDPLYDTVRNDPRFADLLRKAGLASKTR